MKTNLKWIIDLSVRARSIKLLEENLGISLHDLALDSGFLNTTLKATKEKIDKLDFMKIKTKDSIKKVKSHINLYLMRELYRDIKNSYNSVIK